jgi:hypothetical protein
MFVLLGIVVYLGSLALNFPARLAYTLTQELLPASIRFVGLTGSVTRGRGQAVLFEQIAVREVDWAFKPGALLRGRLAYRIRSRLDGGRLSAVVATDPLQRLIVSDLTGDVPLELLQAGMPQGPLLYGRLEPSVDRVTIRDGVVNQAKGRIVARAVAYLRNGALPLGDFSVGVDADGSPIAIGIADAGGPLRLNGQLVVGSDRSYQFEALAAPRESTPPLIELLAQIGTPKQDGQYVIEFGGRLP